MTVFSLYLIKFLLTQETGSLNFRRMIRKKQNICEHTEKGAASENSRDMPILL